jgi:hypothetical protein
MVNILDIKIQVVFFEDALSFAFQPEFSTAAITYWQHFATQAIFVIQHRYISKSQVLWLF